MKSKTFGVTLAVLCVCGQARAQAPASFSGRDFAITVLNGTAPFANSGYALLLPNSSGNGYNFFAISGFQSSKGT